MKSLHSLSLKNYIPEIKRFIDTMMDISVAFNDKLKYLWFMKLLHYRIINYHRRYISKYLPSCVYVLNEFYNPFERGRNEIECDENEYIPGVLLKYFEKLLAENYEGEEKNEKNSANNEKNINNNEKNSNNNEKNSIFNEKNSIINEKNIVKIEKNIVNIEKNIVNNEKNIDIIDKNTNILSNIVKNNLEDPLNSCDKTQINTIKRYENCLIIQELNRIFSEFSYKKSKSTIKSIIRTPWISRLNAYEAIQSLLYLLYYKQNSIKYRDNSVPSQNNHIFKGNLAKKDFLDDSKTFIKTLEEETPIKKSNFSSIKSRYKENMLMKNPFAGQKQVFTKKNVENVKEEEANDVMELHLEKYFPSKSFQTPFKEETIETNKVPFMNINKKLK